MGMDLGDKKVVRSDINVTPLVDVVLVLLIIFMVITPLMEKEMAVRVPETQTEDVPEDVPQNQVVLTMFADGRIFLNKERLSEQDLPARLEAAMRGTPDRIAFINAGDDVDYAQVIHLLDLARGHGVVTIGMLTDEPQDPEKAPMPGAEGDTTADPSATTPPATP